ncbi:DUF927 domain-containing protein [Acinetobacter qingfengensis]|uniref:Uncharacterized protein n=1 Tax=Acinetobacter qingfengensis TaxID=1262585 RepID=A0A1E7RCC4_9GAMM|nr:toprim domain-containing protein [Acinetobacter qingfengensis]KAA8734887.1 DUF927 domain-containing protein [Acinetobacter qingfengensis]OEY96943.1 hypothetical protein BJI46_11720 [Acinetobacter qingfengensis]
MMFPETQALILQRLEHDYGFKAKGNNKLRGRCPDCKHKEASAWTFADEPWVIFCPRKNHCGKENHVRDLYPDLFEKWEKRFQPTPQDPNKTVNAYLVEGRGFPLDQLKQLNYSQEYYKSQEHNLGSITLRFPITDEEGNEGWWQRILDDHGVLQKTTFKFGWLSQHHAWTTPNTNYIESKEIWITEGIFDTIALWLSGITSFSALAAGNYPSIFLNHIAQKCAEAGKSLPKLIWAFDNDNAGHEGILKNIEKAISDGFECEAALPPGGRKKTDWNDLYKQDRLKFTDLETYKYYGSLLIAAKPVDKGILIYKRYGSKSFPFDFHKQVHWFKLDMEKYDDYMKGIDFDDDNEDWVKEEKDQAVAERRDAAILHAADTKLLMDCLPKGLYYQYMQEIDEADYYFQVDFPRGGKTVKNTFSASHIASAAEFKKRLLHIAPGKFYRGNSQQLDAFLERELTDIKRVELINYVGYHAEHQTYVIGDIAYQAGKQFKINKEDYFELPRHVNLKCKAPFHLKINANQADYQKQWITDFIDAYQVKGLLALTAFFSSLFAQQIRKMHKSFPFVELVGEPGTGKTTLLQFLWKLFGRVNYEGIDPNPGKTSKAGLTRTFRQVSNLPIVLIESDREGETAAKQFNWDTLKTLYDGSSLGAQGVKNGGNETYEPPFMGTLIISQNAEIIASEAVMGRIVHVKFYKDQLTKTGLYASRRLSKYEPENVSQFILQCLAKEKNILETYDLNLQKHDDYLHQEQFGIEVSRVVHNHAQLMALFDAMCQHIIDVPEQMQKKVHAELIVMAQNRDKILKSDSTIVQNFWNTVEEMEDAINNPQHHDSVVNHSARSDLFAINFAQLYKVAADYRYSLPDVNELQNALRHSLHYRFIEANKVIQSKITSSSKRCWIFEKPVSNRD